MSIFWPFRRYSREWARVCPKSQKRTSHCFVSMLDHRQRTSVPVIWSYCTLFHAAWEFVALNILNSEFLSNFHVFKSHGVWHCFFLSVVCVQHWSNGSRCTSFVYRHYCFPFFFSYSVMYGTWRQFTRLEFRVGLVEY